MTAQLHDILIMHGIEMFLTTFPVIPRDHPRIIACNKSAIDGREVIFSTACRRRVQGTWEIRDGLLYLVNLVGKFEISGDEPIHADWFSGTLSIPQSWSGDDDVCEFGMTVDKEWNIQICKGEVVETE